MSTKHIVRAGDTLSGIARQHNTTLKVLLLHNPHLTDVSGGVENDHRELRDLKRRDAVGNWIYPGDSVTIVTPDEHAANLELHGRWLLRDGWIITGLSRFESPIRRNDPPNRKVVITWTPDEKDRILRGEDPEEVYRRRFMEK